MHRSKLRYALPVAVVACVAVVGGNTWIDANAGPTLGVPQLTSAPLIGSEDVPETVSAVVAGAAEEVELVVSDPETGESSTFPMHQESGELWVGSIPSNFIDEGNLVYSVTAELDNVTETSQSAELVVLDNLKRSTPTLVERTVQTVLSVSLGEGPNELGVRGGRESATELPPSFAVDAEEHIHFLDAIKHRVLVFDRAGVVTSRYDLNGLTETASDIIVDDEGTAYVLDQVKDAIETITADGDRTYKSGLDLGTQALGAVLAHAADSGTTYIREATQGRFVPVLHAGDQVAAHDRDADMRAGLPTSAGDLAVEVAGNSVTYALSEDRTSGYRLSFADAVLDAPETVVDGTGAIWGLIGVYRESVDRPVVYLVRIDPESGASRRVEVGTSVPGDVTRRLAAAGTGVVLLEADQSKLRLDRFETL